jgi:hypothetical protein
MFPQSARAPRGHRHSHKTTARWAAAAGASLLGVTAACTLLLDRGITQCQSQADCARFGGHPYCQGGVCVESGLMPADCVLGAPQQQSDYLNMCSDAACIPFDDCVRLRLCGEREAGALIAPARDAGNVASTASADAAFAAAAALPNCLDPAAGRGQVVYVRGPASVGRLLAKLTPAMTGGFAPVFQAGDSCAGVASVVASTPIVDPTTGSDASYAVYFTNGTAVPCSVGPAGAPVDVGASDLFASTCGVDRLLGRVGDYLGPIESVVFVVPAKSEQVAISAEAARMVFGMGGNGGAAAPWTTPELYFIRDANDGSQQLSGLAIHVPANAFWGIDRGSPENIVASLRVITDHDLAQQAIGVVSTGLYDGDRGNLKALAFKSKDQECAYLPDSSSAKRDKRNVRDGHYPIWGPLHFFAAISNGVPSSPAARALLAVVSVPNVTKDLLDVFAASSLVPGCAMGVQRDSELGALSPNLAPLPCRCYFEAHESGALPDGCAPCKVASDCEDPATPACNLGYCEVR